MSHVSTTAHYNLPIYGGSDIINPLTDVNGTNEALDTAIYEVAQELASGVTDIADVKNKIGDASLDTASQNLSGAVNELKSAIDTQAGDITDVEANVGTLQSQMATTTGNITTLNTTVAGLQTEVSGKASQTAVNTLATKVGTDALITTADNLSGAVNELATKVGTATLDTTSQNLSGAVNELARKTPDVTVTSDGTITLKQLLNNLAVACDFSKFTKDTIVIAHWGSGTIHYGVQAVFTDGFDAGYMTTVPAQNKIALYCMSAQKTLANCYAYNVIASASGNQFTDNTSLSTGNGDNFEVYY